MKDEALGRELDTLAAKIVKKQTLDVPSLDFTSKVMYKIRLVNSKSSTAYVPLISRKTWGIIGFGLFCVVLFPFLMQDSGKVGVWYFNFKWPQLQLPNILDRLPVILISDTLVYGILAFTLFLYVQILFLKKYFDDRF
jgi:uncharacterized integral membrane protein